MEKQLYFFDLSDDIYSKTKNNDIPILPNVQSILQSVMNILSTRKGERPYNPEFGCNIDDYLFDLNDPVLHELIEKEIKTSILKNEPRITNLEVEVTPFEDDEDLLINLYIEIESDDKNYRLETSLKEIR